MNSMQAKTTKHTSIRAERTEARRLEGGGGAEVREKLGAGDLPRVVLPASGCRSGATPHLRRGMGL